MSACIIPVGPEFQDPPAQPDAPPYVSVFEPSNPGSTVVVSGQQLFSAQVSEATVGDAIYWRWVADPDLSGVARILNDEEIQPSSGKPIAQRISQPIDCQHVDTSTGSSEHQLELVVSTGSFSQSPDQVDVVEDPGAFVVRNFWTVVIACMAGT